MRRTILAAIAFMAIAVLLTASGCVAVRRVRASMQVKTSHEEVQLGGARTLDGHVDMGVGALRISGEATGSSAMVADFTYQPADWKPEAVYAVSGEVGNLRVDMPKDVSSPPFRSMKNVWDIRLASGVPTNLAVDTGVGNSDIDLSRVDVRELQVNTGVGNTVLDLTGTRTVDVTVEIDAGVGQLRMRLPRRIAVRIDDSEKGIGRLNADGFILDGDSLVNQAYLDRKTSNADLPLVAAHIRRGVGNVTLVLAD